ncbi:MAG: carboxylating nicotinate-nucleotide diphosphorylase [Planctomycetota bacterium]
MPPELTTKTIDAALDIAFAEDFGLGDLATNTTIPENALARAAMVSRENCIIAGIPVAQRVFERLDGNVKFGNSKNDGDAAASGETVMTATGRARALLTGERVALNFIQRLSGVATLTKQFIKSSGGKVDILHTRKTTPGLRALERHAVAVAGGKMHRFGLSDEILIKENHFALSGFSISETVKKARAAAGEKITIGAEARNRAEAEQAISAGADYVLLDNYTPELLTNEIPALREMIKKTGRRVLLEASGGIRKENIHLFAGAGVDRISVGALTHSAPAIDFALDVEAVTSISI